MIFHCVKTLDQIVSTNSFYKNLVNLEPLIQKNKRLQQDKIIDDESDISEQLQRIRDDPTVSESSFQQRSRIIIDLNSRISEMEQLLEDKNHEIAELKKNQMTHIIK